MLPSRAERVSARTKELIDHHNACGHRYRAGVDPLEAANRYRLTLSVKRVKS
jgi:hypothetical protein